MTAEQEIACAVLRSPIINQFVRNRDESCARLSDKALVEQTAIFAVRVAKAILLLTEASID